MNIGLVGASCVEPMSHRIAARKQLYCSSLVGYYEAIEASYALKVSCLRWANETLRIRLCCLSRSSVSSKVFRNGAAVDGGFAKEDIGGAGVLLEA